MKRNVSLWPLVLVLGVLFGLMLAPRIGRSQVPVGHALAASIHDDSSRRR